MFLLYDKSYYRAELIKLKPIIKFSYFCEQLDINAGNLSKFLRDEHHLDCMSINNLVDLYNLIYSTFNNN